MPESLISVVPGSPLTQEGVGDDRACRLFKFLWNDKYAVGSEGYRVRVKWNDHDMGQYPDVGISEDLFCQGIDDESTFGLGKGIEDAATELVDSWNKRVQHGEVDVAEWMAIGYYAQLSSYPPFQMGY